MYYIFLKQILTNQHDRDEVRFIVRMKTLLTLDYLGQSIVKLTNY